MRTLAIETATEACSVALFDGERLVAQDHRVLGRGHAEQLVPMIAALPDRGRAARILVSRGPGSFTGVRIGIATGRALGLAWGSEVLGYPTLALVAAMARAGHMFEAVTVCMNGGHGEWFAQRFDRHGQAANEARSLSPQQAAANCEDALLAGNRALALSELLGHEVTALDLLPDARAVLLLDQGTFGPDLSPIYGRAPDAKLPGATAAP